MMKALYFLVPIVAGFAFSGCDRTPPLDQKIAADSYLAFEMWRSRTEPDLTLDQRKDFAAAQWEISSKIIADRKPADSQDTAETMREQIDGKTIREVLERGYGLKLARLNAECTALESFIRHNAERQPVDVESANYLADWRDQQMSRLTTEDEQAESTQQKLDLLLGHPHIPHPPLPPLPESPKPP